MLFGPNHPILGASSVDAKVCAGQPFPPDSAEEGGSQAGQPPRDREDVGPWHAALRPVSRVKRALDVTLSSILIVGLIPLFVVVAIAIRLSGPGPILYSQERVGRDRRRRVGPCNGSERRRQEGHGQPFMMFKFRSMVPDAEQGTGAVWALAHDPRVTPVGRVLRSTHIDELPQLANVLRGEMSLVGPRPERPEIVRTLVKPIPRYALRCQVLPGITGLAQVKNGYDDSLECAMRKVEYDLLYIRSQSLLLDLRLLFATIGYLVSQQGEGRHLAPPETGAPDPIPEVVRRDPPGRRWYLAP